MVGNIVEYENELFLVVHFVNREENWYCSYSRDYYLFPYFAELPDDLEINIKECSKVQIEGVTSDPVKVREDKMPYSQYGFSEIRGEKNIFLERKWNEIKLPTR